MKLQILVNYMISDRGYLGRGVMIGNDQRQTVQEQVEVESTSELHRTNGRRGCEF